MTWNATLNGQSIVLKVRSDMFADMRGAPDWLYCPAVTNGMDISELSSVSDGHRYIQYCAELSTNDLELTPILHSVRINYTTSNPGFTGNKPIIDEATGTIKFRSSYIYYPNQEVVYEHGAVIRAQTISDEKRGFVIHNPPIEITNESGIPTLQISMVELSGSNYSYAGSRSTSVETSYTDYGLVSNNLYFPNLTLSFTTAYPSIWGNWFNTTLEKSGLVKGDENDYKVMVNKPAGTVVVEFYGQGDGVQLYEEKTTVHVRITT